MNTLSLDIKNCNGIHNFQCDINLDRGNDKRKLAIIYAPNGTMKSSLAKTLDSYSHGNDIGKYIFGDIKSCDIKFDGKSIVSGGEDIYVFDPGMDSKTIIDPVLVSDNSLQEQYVEITKDIKQRKDNILTSIKNEVGFSKNTKVNVIEQDLASDFEYWKPDIFGLFAEIKDLLESPDMIFSFDISDLKYNVLFSDKVIKFFKDKKNVELAEDYEKRYQKLLEESNYLGQGGFDHANLNNVGTELSKNKFFKADGKIVLHGRNGEEKVFATDAEINNFLEEEKRRIAESEEIRAAFEKVSKALRDNKDMQGVNEIFNEHPELIIEYTDISLFKKKMWITAFSKHITELDELISAIDEANEKIRNIIEIANTEKRAWHSVIDEFGQRFSVPFRVSVGNQQNVIINADAPVPRFELVGPDNNIVPYEENELEQHILSFGEVRALRVLKMLFQINALKENNQSKLLVFDDVADSFDYRNKYAIIEYLYDIAEYKDENGNCLFSILLLTHNFDFYRTVVSRLNLGGRIYIATRDEENNVKLENSRYFTDIFGKFRNKISGTNDESKSIIISSIPFVRNLIEYSKGSSDPSYNDLTDLLHFKPGRTENYTIKDVDDIFNINWIPDKHIDSSFHSKNYLDFLYEVADDIAIQSIKSTNIECKIVLSIAIRLKAEEYMFGKMPSLPDTEFGKKLREFKKQFSETETEAINLLNDVALMTSENIHINSFMYEPILDISSSHLCKLYQDIKSLK